jgi:hypothetical protein
MKRLLSALFVAIVLPAGAAAQPVGTFEHTFNRDYSVYLKITDRTLEVWQVQLDSDGCMMFPSSIRFENGDLLHNRGTRWGMEEQGDSLTVTFSDTTLVYQRTETEPRDRCGDEQKI